MSVAIGGLDPVNPVSRDISFLTGFILGVFIGLLATALIWIVVSHA